MQRSLDDGRRRRLSDVLVGLGLLAAIVASPARADRIVLRGGGELRGLVVPDAKRPKLVVVQTENSAKPLVLTKEQVVQVVREPGPLDEYLRKEKRVENSAQAHYDLGLWCESNKMPGPAEVQFRRAGEIDPEFGPAQKKLGKAEFDGKWYTFDELRKKQGLIVYKGRWITPQEKQRLESRAAAENETASWARRIKFLRSAVMNGSDLQRREAEAQLAAIRDPAAIGPLVSLLAADSESVRLLLADILGAIPGGDATAALVGRVLAEPDSSIRKATLDALIRRSETDVPSRFLRALASKDQVVVGRAAWALATLRVNSAVPKLVSVLVKTEQKIVVVQTNNGPTAPVYGFNSLGPGAMFGNGSTFGAYTPPVVGQGVVAYGAVGVPYGGNAQSFTTGGAGGGPREEPRVVTYVHQNPEVLAALQELTGQDFGYDVPSWKKWTTTSFRPAPTAPPRRVPQP